MPQVFNLKLQFSLAINTILWRIVLAIIKILEPVNKDISTSTSVVAEYDMNENFFSIWSYKEGDVCKTEGVKQNMQFDKEIARQLRDALNVFLKE